MNNYDFINRNLRVIVELINRGFIPINILKKIEIYEAFHSLSGSKMERYQKLSKKFHLNPDYIRQIIIKMKK